MKAVDERLTFVIIERRHDRVLGHRNTATCGYRFVNCIHE